MTRFRLSRGLFVMGWIAWLTLPLAPLPSWGKWSVTGEFPCMPGKLVDSLVEQGVVEVRHIDGMSTSYDLVSWNHSLPNGSLAGMFRKSEPYFPFHVLRILDIFSWDPA